MEGGRGGESTLGIPTAAAGGYSLKAIIFHCHAKVPFSVSTANNIIATSRSAIYVLFYFTQRYHGYTPMEYHKTNLMIKLTYWLGKLEGKLWLW